MKIVSSLVVATVLFVGVSTPAVASASTSDILVELRALEQMVAELEQRLAALQAAEANEAMVELVVQTDGAEVLRASYADANEALSQCRAITFTPDNLWKRTVCTYGQSIIGDHVFIAG